MRVGQEQYPIRATRKSRNWPMSPKWVQVSHKYHKKAVETGLYGQSGSNCKSVSISHEDREKLEETGQYRENGSKWESKSLEASCGNWQISPKWVQVRVNVDIS